METLSYGLATIGGLPPLKAIWDFPGAKYVYTLLGIAIAVFMFWNILLAISSGTAVVSAFRSGRHDGIGRNIGGFVLAIVMIIILSSLGAFLGSVFTYVFKVK